MSSTDPRVSDLNETDLSRILPVGGASAALPQAIPARILPPFVPDTAAENGERFILAMAFEGQNPSTAPRGSRVFFPVNPEEFTWTQNRQMGTYDILNGPQATQLGSMQIRVLQLALMLPYVYEADYCIPYPKPKLDKSPQEVRLWLHNAQRAGYPLDFWCIPLRDHSPIFFPKMRVVISSLNTSYKAGNPLDIFLELELTELVEPTIVRTATSTVAGPTYAFTKRVTKPGDSLLSIARLAYGKAYAPIGWKQILAKNKIVVDSHHKRKPLRNNKGKTKPMHSTTSLLPGQHLVIPPPKASTR